MCSDVLAGAASGPPGAPGLEIRLAIEKTQPLIGTASTSGKVPISFVGWLEMLRAIADLADTTEHTTTTAAGADENRTM